MKIRVLTSNLQKKLSFANHAISAKSQLPILLTFLLEATNDTLRIKSTDLEIGIELELPAEIDEEGSLAVPAKTFTELIASLPEDTITLESKEGLLEVMSKRTKSIFQTMNKDEFPRLYDEKGEKVTTLSHETLKKGFASVIFAASSDAARPALTGVLVKQEDGGFLLVATDGYRLSLKHQPTEQKTAVSEKELSLLVPARVFREVISLKESGDIDMFISAKNNQIVFSESEMTLIGRLIEAEFPPYERIIPSDHASQVRVNREELLKAVKICSIFARETANIIKFSLKNERMVVSSQTPSVGENTVEVEATLTGEENEIAFNARYLLEVLSHLEEDELVFEMTGPLNPGVFKIYNDTSYLHLIMPIRLQTEV
jgi:DNA polymerase III subunit beta